MELDNGNLVGTVLLDFSSAFDVIDHSLLLDKLNLYGFTLTALKWMESYLTNRRQTVFFNGSLSKVRSVTCGEPQGSCLGPLLLAVFTNDFPIAMYAGDSTIYASATSTEKLND
ncbi:hypothetical protein LDENG_00202400, partial [Lucifuga dentata]